MTAVMIVEDEARIASFLTKGLKAAGFVPKVVDNGADAVEMALLGEADIILLDVGLPDIDGFEVLERIRGQGVSTPVIMLTARSSVADRVAGLEGGADDYLPKPFSFDELVARIRLRLRPQETAAPDPGLLVHRDLALDIRTRRVRVNGEWVDLSAREFALAEVFMRHPDQVLSREQLLANVWGLDFDPGSNVVDVYVSYLRSKLGKDRLETVRGVGYRLS
ncbi:MULTISPECIES: response regulator transcription factor [unclassified Actinomyces]|uniref:response regulator transcription factor n=1 Tax=unclassified Actinomyces TaxID=2609248 RepID=UPI0013744B5A|nr:MULTISPECIES: response regulator transcription factor [unclassified Actinomyces]MBW3069926.1 response regulator transcription factor [Actinomyces sp. 594]NDR54003.1 response regulator transcription factor [Actinomyces sp. 565]QHO90650.1 DNA-binding response regulator [Actinomyces sp. 432]